MYGLLLLLHLLAATIWTGGHIVLSLVVLPKVLKEQSPEQLLNFESVSVVSQRSANHDP